MNFRKKIAEKSLRWGQRIAVRNAQRNMRNLNENYKEFIFDIQEQCGKVIEMVPENQQGNIVTVLCTNILQGFDTQEEMNTVITMIQTTINEYWKRKDIPQKS